MHKTRSWKHNQKTRKAWGSPKENKRLTPFMVEDMEEWNSEMQYKDTDDGIAEEV